MVLDVANELIEVQNIERHNDHYFTESRPYIQKWVIRVARIERDTTIGYKGDFMFRERC